MTLKKITSIILSVAFILLGPAFSYAQIKKGKCLRRDSRGHCKAWAVSKKKCVKWNRDGTCAWTDQTVEIVISDKQRKYIDKAKELNCQPDEDGSTHIKYNFETGEPICAEDYP